MGAPCRNGTRKPEEGRQIWRFGGKKGRLDYVRCAKEYRHTPDREEPAPVSQQTLNLPLLKIPSIVLHLGGVGGGGTQAAEPGVT